MKRAASFVSALLSGLILMFFMRATLRDRLPPGVYEEWLPFFWITALVAFAGAGYLLYLKWDLARWKKERMLAKKTSVAGEQKKSPLPNPGRTKTEPARTGMEEEKNEKRGKVQASGNTRKKTTGAAQSKRK